MEREVVLTGLGGQGIQLLAKLLAHAAMREGRQVMTFGLFMGMIRGGSSEATVVVADGAVVAPPIVPRVWGVVAMHGAGLPALQPKSRPGGVLVLNATLAPEPPGWDGVRRLAVPATEIAKAVGQPLGAGMVALGALAGATGLVAPASLAAALADVVPPHRRKLVDANAACIARGAEWGTERGGPPAWDGVVCSARGEGT